MIDTIIFYSLIQAARDIIRAFIESRGENIEKIRSDNYAKQIESIANSSR